MKSFRNVFFDLDGTLTDPGLGIVNCISAALVEFGREVPPTSTLETFIAPPLRQTFSKLLATNDSQSIEQAICAYRKRFSKKGMFENYVYQGIPDVLAELKNAEKNLYVVTAKPQQFASQIVEYFDLEKYFNDVYGTTLDGRFEDKGELISHILAANGLKAEESLMVGDRESDMIAAKVNNISSLGVTYGYGSLDELISSGADAICDSPQKIPEIIAGLP